MTSKLRKQRLKPRCLYEEEMTMKHTVPSSTPKNNEKDISDSYSVQPGSSSSTVKPQPEKNIENHKGEEVPTLNQKISLIKCCEQDFEKKFGFRRHIRTKHVSTKEELRLCLHCHTMVKATAAALIIHMRGTHLTDSQGSFAIADDEFLNKNSSTTFLKVSNISVQKNKKEVVFTCKICKVVFLDKKKYKEHQKCHEKKVVEKIFYSKKCECGITFHEKGQYKSHWNLMHSGNYTTCSNCNTLIENNNMYAHVNVNQFTSTWYYNCRKWKIHHFI